MLLQTNIFYKGTRNTGGVSTIGENKIKKSFSYNFSYLTFTVLH